MGTLLKNIPYFLIILFLNRMQGKEDKLLALMKDKEISPQILSYMDMASHTINKSLLVSPHPFHLLMSE